MQRVVLEGDVARLTGEWEEAEEIMSQADPDLIVLEDKQI